MYTEITRKKQTIILEDLNVSGMTKKRKLSKVISETRMGNIQNIFRMDLQKNMVVISEWLVVGNLHLKLFHVVVLKVENYIPHSLDINFHYQK